MMTMTLRMAKARMRVETVLTLVALTGTGLLTSHCANPSADAPSESSIPNTAEGSSATPSGEPPPTAPKVASDDGIVPNTPSENEGIKWHPGHYAWPGGLRYANWPSVPHLASTLSFMDAHCKESALSGFMIRAYWQSLEGPVAGDYTAGFAFVDQLIAKAQSCGKKLMLAVQPVAFGSAGADRSAYFPAYIVNGSQYGSSLNGNGNVLFARSWQQATSDRLIALTNAYGARYDSNPTIELWEPTGETAMALEKGVDGFSTDALFTQLARILQAARQAWPHTQVRLHANWASNAKQFIDIFDACVGFACSIGGPDILPREAIMANQIYAGLFGGTDHRGTLPFVAEIQSPELGGKEGTWSPAQLYAAAADGYQVQKQGTWGSPMTPARATTPSHFIWINNTYAGGDAQRWNTGILPFIRTLAGKTPTKTCPTAFGACIE